MVNMHIKFKVSSSSRSRDILRALKFKMVQLTWPRPFEGRLVICRLGPAMFNPRIGFEMPTISCNEEVKGNAKCKNSIFEPPFGDLGVTHRIHLWLDGKRVVDFVLTIIEIFASSHGWGTSKRNLSTAAFSDGGESI